MNYDFITPDLIVGSCLQTPADVDKLRNIGVKTIYCLQQDSDLEYFSVDIGAIREYASTFNDIQHLYAEIRHDGGEERASLVFWKKGRMKIQVDRCAQVESIARHRACTGIRSWCKLIHYLIETKCLFRPISENLYNPERNFWKLDHMESSTRMRRCLRRNFEGSDHFGAAANYEDPVELKHDKENVASHSKASILPTEAISMELVNEDDEQDDIVHVEGKTDDMRQVDDIQTRLSGTAEQQLHVPDSTEPQVGNNEDFVRSSVVDPGYIPSEHDERVILELSTSMV